MYFRALTIGFLFWLGLRWCQDVWNRRHEDIEILRTSENVVRKVVIVFYWVLSLAIPVVFALVIIRAFRTIADWWNMLGTV